MKLILLCLLVITFSFPNAQSLEKNNFYIDRSKVVVLKKLKYDTNTKSATLTKTDYALIEKILKNCLDHHNSTLDSSSYEFLKLDEYNRQYFPFFKEGKKMVWVNCFCGNTKDFPYWKKKPVLVFDGGSCFFNVIINLSTQEYFNLYVNGIAELFPAKFMNRTTE